MWPCGRQSGAQSRLQPSRMKQRTSNDGAWYLVGRDLIVIDLCNDKKLKLARVLIHISGALVVLAPVAKNSPSEYPR
jgi:hypothetical protein